jgi:hypothetical protein
VTPHNSLGGVKEQKIIQKPSFFMKWMVKKGVGKNELSESTMSFLKG